MERAFGRDGENVKNAAVVLLIGLGKGASAMLNCGSCGVDAEPWSKEGEGYA